MSDNILVVCSLVIVVITVGFILCYVFLFFIYFCILNRYMAVDFRSLRYPGMVSYKALLGDGCTGYAVAMFHAALTTKNYVCPLEAETLLPMMYINDCIRGTVEFVSADVSRVPARVYNMTAMSFYPRILHAIIREYCLDFNVTYAPDNRQIIAASWPDSLDDSQATKDWAWKPQYDLRRTTIRMLNKLHKRYALNTVIRGVTDVDVDAML